MKIEFSFDDGRAQDIRLASLLQKYNIPATFYIPLECGLTEKEIVWLSKHFNIGSHTVNHPDLTNISAEQVRFELEYSKFELERVIHRGVDKFCYPKGRHNEEVKEAVKDAGYKSARTVVMHKHTKPVDPFAEWTSVSVYPKREGYYDDFLTYAVNMLNKAEDKGKDGYYHVWGHSWEIDKYDMWNDFEMLLQIVKTRAEKHENSGGTVVRTKSSIELL